MAYAEIGVIGGSGFYSFLDDATSVDVDTPFGSPSDPPVVGVLGGRPVAFVPRHGRDHRYLPHQVNYRANLWAFRALGVRQVLAPCAVGSLRADLAPGSLVALDQVIDRTHGRAHTVYDRGSADAERPGRPVVHVAFADPYCPRGRVAVVAAASESGEHVRDGGTLVVINGPRFSSRAESRWHATIGADVVGMTGMPEAGIARELAMCFSSVALVTDLDAGVDSGEGVTHAEVLAVFAQNVERVKAVVAATVPALPTDDDCACRRSLDGLDLPIPLP